MKERTRQYLVAASAHELRNALHAIQIQVELLHLRLGRIANPEDALRVAGLRSCALVEQEVTHVTELLTGLVALAGPGEDPPKEVDAQAFLAAVVAATRTRLGLSDDALSLRFEPGPGAEAPRPWRTALGDVAHALEGLFGAWFVCQQPTACAVVVVSEESPGWVQLRLAPVGHGSAPPRLSWTEAQRQTLEEDAAAGRQIVKSLGGALVERKRSVAEGGEPAPLVLRLPIDSAPV